MSLIFQPNLLFSPAATGDQARFARLRRLFSSGSTGRSSPPVEVDMEQLKKDCWMGIPHKLRPQAWRLLSVSHSFSFMRIFPYPIKCFSFWTSHDSLIIRKFLLMLKSVCLKLRNICKSTSLTEWFILFQGYLPTNVERREVTLQRKRDEYWHYVEQYFHSRFDDGNAETFRQVWLFLLEYFLLKSTNILEEKYFKIHIDIPRMCPLIPLFQQKLVQEVHFLP